MPVTIFLLLAACYLLPAPFCPNVEATAKGAAPVGWWQFNEGGGATAYDEAKANNGTITIGGSGSQTTIGSAWTNGATGKFGSALSFDGTDDYVNTGSGLDFASSQFSSGYTIASWVKPTATPASKKAIFSSALGTSGTDWQVYVWYDTNTTFGTAQRYSGTQNDFAGSAHAAGSWYHVVVTWDGATTRLYVNGVLENSASGGKPNNQPANREVRIGNFKGYTNSEFAGLIDDVRVYNYNYNYATTQLRAHGRAGPPGLPQRLFRPPRRLTLTWGQTPRTKFGDFPAWGQTPFFDPRVFHRFFI